MPVVSIGCEWGFLFFFSSRHCKIRKAFSDYQNGFDSMRASELKSADRNILSSTRIHLDFEKLSKKIAYDACGDVIQYPIKLYFNSKKGISLSALPLHQSDGKIEEFSYLMQLGDQIVGNPRRYHREWSFEIL